MANVNVSGILMCSDGTTISLSSTIADDAGESSLQTSTTYSVTASNVGDYAPGKVIVKAMIQSDANLVYAYVLRQGLIATILPISIKGLGCQSPLPLLAGFQMQPGDIVRVLVLPIANRTVAVNTYTNQGVYRIFDVATASGNVEPIDLQTGNSVGDTLQGQVIVKAWCAGGNAANCVKVVDGGALMLNEKGMPVGSVPVNAAPSESVYWSDVSIPVALNYKWRIASSS